MADFYVRTRLTPTPAFEVWQESTDSMVQRFLVTNDDWDVAEYLAKLAAKDRNEGVE
jgi:hypothetical protein